MVKLPTIAILSSLVTCSGLAYADFSTTDLGVIDKGRILYWLEKRGELAVNASDEEKQQAFNRYITNRTNNKNNKLPKVLANNTATNNNVLKNLVVEKELTKAPNVSKAFEDVEGVTPVLAILIDFQDLKFNNHGLTSIDTSMFYNEYPKSHYENLLFSPTGFTGPQGQTLQSAHQYYFQESGESLIFDGNVFGWVTADNTAKFYGENNNDINNLDGQDDKNVGQLVIEAVEKTIAQNNIDLSDYDKVNNNTGLNVPDGIVDHIMIFHSSIGEESGGGDLGDDAIWSHRSAVFTEGFDAVTVQGSDVKIFNYTITPIDSSIGVVVHEFGHSLGVPDEYDLNSDDTGAPVQAWSVMASGSWLGIPRGSVPSSFSPYAKEFFQNRYGGNWVNQQTVTLSDSLNETISLTSASTHDGNVDQIKVNLPILPKDFGQPFSGSYQYYSTTGNQLQTSLRFNTTVGNNNPTLNLKARWDIEQDYDYVQIKVNNIAIAGNHTTEFNPIYATINNFISGDSASIAGSSQDLGWVDLVFDLSSFSNQNVSIDIIYRTDPSVTGYGFAADDIQITSGSAVTFSNGAETLLPVSLNGFSRIMDTVEGGNHYYYIQLRDHNGTDSGLPLIGYDPGVLVWYRDEYFENNNVSEHAGELFIGVVDADQNLIMRNNTIRNTEAQIRDAAFSLFSQSITNTDTSLTNTFIFDDSEDYTAPLQPKSGVILPTLGFNMEIITQASDSSTASILLTKNEAQQLTPDNETTNPTTTASDSGSSGGSMYWLTLMLLGSLRIRYKKYK